MARSGAPDYTTMVIVGSLVVGTILLVAIILSPVAFVGIPAYIGYRLWRDSPARAERIARTETEALYNHALRGQVTLSDAEIERGLRQHWPADMPDALRIQLLQAWSGDLRGGRPLTRHPATTGALQHT